VAKGVYLVTGAAGFLGGAACSLLERRGEPYLGIDRAVRGAAASNIIQCDVTDIHALHALATRNSILGIIHCGAFSGPMVARDNPHAIVQVNVVGAANVLELARVHGIERFVFCSSAGVYGNTPGGRLAKMRLSIRRTCTARAKSRGSNSSRLIRANMASTASA